MKKTCAECGCPVTDGVHQYSVREFGFALCMQHQDWLDEFGETVTEAALRLYFALRRKGVPAELEKWDGYKSIDIAVVAAKLNIEVDGGHHNWNARQALADLQRTHASFLKGYVTLRIPNVLTDDDIDLEQTADLIAEMVNKSIRQKGRFI